VEGLNSDGNSGGYSNLEELEADARPGWVEGGNGPFTGDLDPLANQTPVADAAGPYSGLVGEGPGGIDGLERLAVLFIWTGSPSVS
jgi:hypothetical protein